MRWGWERRGAGRGLIGAFALEAVVLWYGGVLAAARASSTLDTGVVLGRLEESLKRELERRKG
ncbi:MAG TPA: hypothetical protein VE153_24655 [Myxococcus sp.]|nr:hypothetical protein [Myxococcus sp.]